MPAAGLPWLPAEELLTVDEIDRLTRLFVGLGIREVKLTGGEPTVRGDLVEIVRRLRAVEPALELSMTTNGLLLARLASSLRAAGLDRVTVSCDSLLRHRYEAMTRRDALERVRAGLIAADEAGFSPIKINCVVVAGTNEDEVLDFAELARSTGYEVRFIEYMPLDADHTWERSKVVPSAQILERISTRYPLVSVDQDGGPATTFRFADGARGTVGFISSVTEPFCASCNRLRLTADGQLRTCLFSLTELDLRGPMRAGADNAELERLIGQAVAEKWAGHRIGRADFVRPAKSMSLIGG
jgi:cyclic pyranopterin phosphate synthase